MFKLKKDGALCMKILIQILREYENSIARCAFRARLRLVATVVGNIRLPLNLILCCTSNNFKYLWQFIDYVKNLLCQIFQTQI